MEGAQHGIAPARRNAGADRDIFGEARRVGRRKREPVAAAIAADRPPDRAFGRDVDRIRRSRFDAPRDLAPVRYSDAQALIGRYRHRRKAVRCQKFDLGSEISRGARERSQRAHHAIHLRVPGIGRDQDPHHANPRVEMILRCGKSGTDISGV